MREEEEGIIPQDLLLIDFRAYLQNEILQMLRHVEDIENRDETASHRKYIGYVSRMINLIMEWKKFFKDEPYMMEVYLR